MLMRRLGSIEKRLALALLVGGCSASSMDDERTGVASSAATSADINVACGGASHASVAVQGGVALVAWAAGPTDIDIARIDADGHLLDATPIHLGHPQDYIAGWPMSVVAGPGRGVAVVPTATGFIVVATYETPMIGQLWGHLATRSVDLSGSAPSDWQVRKTVFGTYLHQHLLGVRTGGFDGTHSYIVEVDSVQQGGFNLPARSIDVVDLGNDSSVLSLSPIPGDPPVNPVWGGFACGANGCLATWRDVMQLSYAQVLGQGAVSLSSFIGGAVAPTPSGFLVFGYSNGEQAQAFSPTGQPMGGQVALGAYWPEVMSAVYDGTATRAAWANVNPPPGDGTYSATYADDGTTLTGPLLEIPGWTSDFDMATFGAGRSLIAHATASGVVARYVGSLPASVSPGCTMGGGGGGAGGSGGAGSSASTTSSQSSASGASVNGSTSGAGGSTSGTQSSVSSGSSGSGGGGGASASGSATSSASGSGATSSGSAGGETVEQGACACRVGSSARPSPEAMGALGALAFAFAARRRRRSSLAVPRISESKRARVLVARATR